MLQTENTPSIPISGALVSQHHNDLGQSQSKNGRKGGGSNSEIRTQDSGVVVCHYCNKPGHMKRDCWTLQNKITRNHSSHIAPTVSICESEFARLPQHQEPLKSPSSLVNDTNLFLFRNGYQQKNLTNQIIDYPNPQITKGSKQKDLATKSNRE